MPSWSFEYVIPVRRVGPLLAIFAVIGCFIGGLGAYVGIQKYWYLQRAVEVSGTVAKIENRGGSYAPIVHYTDQIGNLRILYPTSWSSTPHFYEGQTVGVLYDPSDPDYPLTASINTFGEKWQLAIFLLGFGAFWLFFVSMFWLASRSPKASTASRSKRAKKDSSNVPTET